MHVRYVALASAFTMAASSAFAQTPAASQSPLPTSALNAVTPAPVIAPIAAPNQAVLRTGTPVPMRMSEALTTEGKKLRVGQRFRLETVEPVSVDGQIVIPAGSPGMGEVTDVRNKGMWGKSGRINGRVLYLIANGRQIRMSGQLDDKGRTGTAGVIGSVAVIPLAGFFVTGTSARIPLGGPVNGFIDEDVPLAFAAATPTPMTVGAPASTMSVATPAAPVGGVSAPALIPAVATTPASAAGAATKE